MAKPPSDPQSYYSIASIHGLPQSFCLHHEDRYNPWHRVYLKMFEDALRSVPGCGDVTLPYWDIKTPIPDLLKTPPFDSYVVPVASPGIPPNFKTERNSQAMINSLLARFDVFNNLDTALKQSLWGISGISGYQDGSIAAHDGGHSSIGPTMGDQDVASYDPIFWFFHCNLDRHLLKWQGKVGAGTLTGFKSTLSGNTDWLTAPFNALDPFTTTADQAIEFGIAYEEPPELESVAMAAFENRVGSLEATRTFTIPRSPDVSVMVKDIDRLNIPGSFVVQTACRRQAGGRAGVLPTQKAAGLRHLPQAWSDQRQLPRRTGEGSRQEALGRDRDSEPGGNHRCALPAVIGRQSHHQCAAAARGPLAGDEFRLKRLLLTSPRRGEVEAGAQRRLRVRGLSTRSDSRKDPSPACASDDARRPLPYGER